MRISSIGDVTIAIHAAKRIGEPARTPGVCTCSPPCISGIPIFKEVTNMQLTENEKKVAINVGLTEAGFMKAKDWDGKLGVMGASPFPDHKPDNFDDNRGCGPEPVDAKNTNVGLGECCKSGTMSHLEGHRASIQREIDRRGDSSAHRVRFAK